MRLEHLLSGARRDTDDVRAPPGTSTRGKGAAAISPATFITRRVLKRVRKNNDKTERPFAQRSPVLLMQSIAFGGLAQLARAPALQAGGQRFESVILHSEKEDIDMMEAADTALHT